MKLLQRLLGRDDEPEEEEEAPPRPPVAAPRVDWPGESFPLHTVAEVTYCS